MCVGGGGVGGGGGAGVFVCVYECVVLSPCPLLYMKNGMQSEEPDLRGAV